MNQILIHHIAKHIDLSQNDREKITTVFTERSYRRKEKLLSEGSPCQQLFFITSGVVRAYCLNEEGKEVTVMFAMKDWWITDMQAFLNKLSSSVTIESIKDSTVMVIQKSAFDELFNVIPQFNTFWRILMQNAYCREQNRVVQNLTLKASARYHQFIEAYPTFVELLTQRQIASYLGITPEFLSTIKSKSES